MVCEIEGKQGKINPWEEWEKEVLPGGGEVWSKPIDPEIMKKMPESKKTFLDVTVLDLVVDDLRGFGRRIVQIFSRSSKEE